MHTYPPVRPTSLEQESRRIQRRRFLGAVAAGSLAIGGGPSLLADRSTPTSGETVRIGLLADLHHDLIPDGKARLGAFLTDMQAFQPDAIVQLGDFAFPDRTNESLVESFQSGGAKVLHVIGNHDLDNGLTKEDCCHAWNLSSPWYAVDVSGVRLIVLDGNERGSPQHRGGYPSYIGPVQREWLDEQLASSPHPVIVLSHQPLAGTIAIDNAGQLQETLSDHSDKVWLAINGHSHTDDLLRVGGVSYLHLNSASYYWVGADFAHRSYPVADHERYPALEKTCPYRAPLFGRLEVDLGRREVRLVGRQTEWIGPSPTELGMDSRTLTPGEEIAPQIRDRLIRRAVSR